MLNKIRILLVDDHPVVRAGMEGILASQDDIQVIGQAADGREAVKLAAELQPDVVLMDLRMPELDGVGAIQEILAADNPPKILVLTTYDTDADIVRSIEVGASGYLLKDTPPDELFRGIRAVARGESVLAPAVAARLMGRIREPGDEMLSGREIEVLSLVSRGHSNREIAKALHISTATVKTHLIHIFDKLGVDDRTAAVTVALEKGILRLNRW